MHSLWQLHLDWDESLPQDLHTMWIEFEQHLINLILSSLNMLVAVELHGFCNASEFVYGACIYLRSMDKRGQYIVRLLCARSQVTPLKKISLPKLELSGVLLLAYLTQKIIVAGQ